MIEDESVVLSEFGFDNYKIYPNGDVANCETGKILLPSTIGHITLYRNRIKKQFLAEKLKRQVFGWEWCWIPEHEKRDLSFLGEDYSKFGITKSGQFYNLTTGTRCDGTIDDKGYVRVKLSFSKINCNYKRLHRIVALAFIPNPDNLEQVNHIDGVKTNNRVENLEWCCNLDNLQHASNSGLTRAPPEEVIRQACSLLQAGFSISQVMSVLHLPRDTLYRLFRGSRSDITKDYDLSRCALNWGRPSVTRRQVLIELPEPPKSLTATA